MPKRRKLTWDADSVKGLRRHLALTQDELAGELGVRQQTVSEWETGVYRPRGASERVLSMVAEDAGFVWGAAPAAGRRPEVAGRTSGDAPAAPEAEAARPLARRRSEVSGRTSADAKPARDETAGGDAVDADEASP